MANRSKFLHDLEIFHSSGLVEIANVVHQVKNRAQPFFPVEHTEQVSQQMKQQFRLPSGVLLQAPSIQYTPHLERLMRQCPLKILNHTVCVFKLYQAIKKQRSSDNNKSESDENKENGNSLNKLSTWKKIAQTILDSNKNSESKAKLQFPPSMINKFKLIYATFLEPYETAIFHTLEEARKRAIFKMRQQQRDQHMRQMQQNGQTPQGFNDTPVQSRVPGLHEETSRGSFGEHNSPGPSTPQAGGRMARTNPKYADYDYGLEDEEEEPEDKTMGGMFDKKEDTDKDFHYRPSARRSTNRGPSRWNKDQLLTPDESSKKTSKITHPFRPQIARTPPEYASLLCSLESGLPNERDFALNAVSMLTSSVAQNIAMTQLYSCKMKLNQMYDRGARFLESLMRHSGVNPDYVADADELISFWCLLCEDEFTRDLNLDRAAYKSKFSNVETVLKTRTGERGEIDDKQMGHKLVFNSVEEPTELKTPFEDVKSSETEQNVTNTENLGTENSIENKSDENSKTVKYPETTANPDTSEHPEKQTTPTKSPQQKINTTDSPTTNQSYNKTNPDKNEPKNNADEPDNSTTIATLQKPPATPPASSENDKEKNLTDFTKETQSIGNLSEQNSSENFDKKSSTNLDEKSNTLPSEMPSGSNFQISDFAENSFQPVPLTARQFESILLRITTIAEIIRNLSFSVSNCRICWESDDMQRFLLLLLRSKLPSEETLATQNCSSLQQSVARTRSSLTILGLDILSNMSQIVQLDRLNIHTQSTFLEMVSAFPNKVTFLQEHNLDKSRDSYLRIIQTLANLSRINENRGLLEQNLDEDCLGELVAQCSVPDVETILYTLEVFLALSELSEKFCRVISKCKGAIKMFIDLLSLNIRNQPQRVLSAVILRQPTIRVRRQVPGPSSGAQVAQGSQGQSFMSSSTRRAVHSFPGEGIFPLPEAPQARFYWPETKRAKLSTPEPTLTPSKPAAINKTPQQQTSTTAPSNKNNSSTATKLPATSQKLPHSISNPPTNGTCSDLPLPNGPPILNGHSSSTSHINGCHHHHPSSDDDHGLNSDFSEDSRLTGEIQNGTSLITDIKSFKNKRAAEKLEQINKLNGHSGMKDKKLQNGSTHSSASGSTITNGGGANLLISEDDDSKQNGIQNGVTNGNHHGLQNGLKRPDSVANSACSDLESNPSCSPQSDKNNTSGGRLNGTPTRKIKSRQNSGQNTEHSLKVENSVCEKKSKSSEQTTENQETNKDTDANAETHSDSNQDANEERPERVSTPPEMFTDENLSAHSGRQVLKHRHQIAPLSITDFTDCIEKQDAISKHIQLTSALVLTNIVSSNDSYSKKVVRQYRHLLARIAFSRMDCAIQVARCLFEIDGCEAKQLSSPEHETNKDAESEVASESEEMTIKA